MMDVSRRSFLGGALALTAASSLPLKAFALAPTIWGDGIHDDTAGLQAALDGKPFRVVGEGAFVISRDGEVFIGNGTYRLTDTLRLRGSIRATLRNFHMRWDSLPDGAACIEAASGGHILENGHIEGPKPPGLHAYNWGSGEHHVMVRVEA